MLVHMQRIVRHLLPYRPARYASLFLSLVLASFVIAQRSLAARPSHAWLLAALLLNNALLAGLPLFPVWDERRPLTLLLAGSVLALGGAVILWLFFHAVA